MSRKPFISLLVVVAAATWWMRAWQPSDYRCAHYAGAQDSQADERDSCCGAGPAGQAQVVRSRSDSDNQPADCPCGGPDRCMCGAGIRPDCLPPTSVAVPEALLVCDVPWCSFGAEGRSPCPPVPPPKRP